MPVKDFKDFWKFNLRNPTYSPQAFLKTWTLFLLIDRSQHSLTQRKENSCFTIAQAEQMKK